MLIIAAGALILIAPGVVVSLAWSAEAASPIILGSLVGAIATVALGWRLALVEVFILGMSIPVAVVAGAEPLAGSAGACNAARSRRPPSRDAWPAVSAGSRLPATPWSGG